VDVERAIRRVDRAEGDAYVALYAAAAELGCGSLELDGIRAVWSARDDDPGFSCVLNLADAPDPGAMLGRLEERVAANGAGYIGIDIPPSLVSWGTPAELESRGYVPDYDEYIVVADLTRRGVASSPTPDLRVERIVDPALRSIFAETLNIGYDVAADHVRGYVFGSTIGMPNWYHYIAWIEDQPASTSVMFTVDGVADLFVTTTVPDFRGRGAQNALIAQRVADAREAGCDLATSQVIVSNASPRNMARQQFEVVYRRSIWGKRLTDG
jgi:hypothetical protein